MLDLGAKSSGQNWRLLKALSMDFYAPMKAFALYLHLFPEENLDPEAALPRIYSSVLRVKKWLKSQQVPIEIEHSDAGYRLIWTAPFVLRIPSAINFQKISSTGFEILLKNFSTQSFSSTEAAMVLDLPQRSVARLLKEAAIGENLEVTGQGRKTRYRFKNAKAS